MALSILVADDNEMNRWLLAEQLQQWSTDVVSASDGREAWELLRNNRYSLVFLDVNMPFMNGFELVKKARAESVNHLTPIIAVTAHIQIHQRHLLVADGFNECLIKPIVLADLLRVIERWCATENGENGGYYANAILEKTEHNRSLGRVFLQKLLQDTPAQLADLQRALQMQQCQQAWTIAHKLHGTFCFYGFADFRALAEKLEQCLRETDLSMAMQQFDLLNAKFAELRHNESKLLLQLS
ncbi:response regulator [Methylomonas sp. LL1]|uniref:Hpt domain-containing response regulator n=1 Tax=Methylomonas sp. LL1 TaxID=2785785 RepID=UPI0018C42042|nr:response regulator [Methylomonas sp. LL1]QPK63344.1 response regulator [Methylomonas sp. LL1]